MKPRQKTIDAMADAAYEAIIDIFQSRYGQKVTCDELNEAYLKFISEVRSKVDEQVEYQCSELGYCYDTLVNDFELVKEYE